MWTHPQFDPVIFAIGPLAVRWYGLMYVLGFAGAYLLAVRRAPRYGFSKEQVSDLIFYSVLGVVVGGRIGYVLFYGFDNLLQNPLYLFKVWEGGMSFHGGLVGCMLGIAWGARRWGRSWFELTDFYVVQAPIGLFCGRMGNFINGELYGRVTDANAWWGMKFPQIGDGLARHPSMLYEALLEGVVLLIILLIFTRKPRPLMATSGLFLAGYGVFRTVVEFARQPDAHMGSNGFLYGTEWLTTGMILSSPMWIAGLALMAFAYSKNRSGPYSGIKV